MEIRKGIAVSPGVAIAPAIVLDSEQFRIPRRSIEQPEVEAELGRLQGAVERAKAEVRDLRQRVANDVGEKLGAIFDVQDALLTDPKVVAEIRELVQRERYAPEYAVATILRGYAKKFLNLPNRYMAERVSDVYDVEKRLLRNQPDVLAVLAQVQAADVPTVHQKLSPLELVEARHQSGQAALASAGVAYQCQGLFGSDFQSEVRQHCLLFRDRKSVV
jgi:phosphoenolpyruvate-protein kinase (PTS system EI component)